MKPLYCIRHQLSAPLGVIADVVAEQRADWCYVDPWNGHALPDVADVGGLIVLGGEMNADEVLAYPWLADTRTLMREAVDADLPVLGVCLGAQILARAAGADVVRGGVREIGFRKVEVLPAGGEDPLLGAFAPSALVFQFHEDQCRLPTEAQLLARSDDCDVQAFRYGARGYGVQFHFEVTTREISAWCDEVPPEELRDVWGATKAQLLAEADLHLAAQQAAGRRLTEAFVGLLS